MKTTLLPKKTPTTRLCKPRHASLPRKVTNIPIKEEIVETVTDREEQKEITNEQRRRSRKHK